MASPTIVSASGVSTQRQVDALYSSSKLYPTGANRKASLSTGITVEYTLHSTTTEALDSNDDSEVRLVLIMGFLQPKESWGATVDHLLATWGESKGKSLKIVSFDNRGVGGSDAPWWRYTTSQMAEDALALMDHLGWKTAHIAGISMGGMISLELASAAPKRVESLTLMVTTRGKYTADPRSGKPLRGSTFAKDPTKIAKFSLELLYPDAFLDNKMADSDASVRDVLFTFHETKAKTRVSPTFFGLVGQLLAVRTHFVSDERLAAINAAGFPILIVGSMMDILIPTQESLTLHKHLSGKHVETLFFDKGGHGVTVQFSDEIAAAMVQKLLDPSIAH